MATALKQNARFLTLAATLVLAFASLPTHAAFVNIDDFESYTVGDGTGDMGGDWWGSAQVATDPADSGNQVLSYTGSNASHSYRGSDIEIANGTTATLFFRARIEGATDPDFGMGMSDFAAPSSWSAYEAQLTWQNDGSSVGVRNGSSATTTDDAWYLIWMVIDNTNDEYDVYLQSDDDSNFSSQTKIGSTAAFRNGSANNDLVSFFLNTNAGNTAPAYIDDIYLDTTGESLKNPLFLIPEPSTLALVLILGGLALPRRGRRNESA